MLDRFDRENNLIGEDSVNFLHSKKVAVFGLGGVGSFALESLARGGVGEFIICDGDKVDITNINRQLFALDSTVGKMKVDVAFDRLKDINPQIKIDKKPIFFEESTLNDFDFSGCDYIVDCIDRVTSKLLLVKISEKYNIPIITCLGTGNKLDNTIFKVSDIFKTSVCPLAKVMRKELKDMGVKSLKVVYSEEKPKTPKCEDKRTPSSISFVPPTAGLIIGGEVIKDLLKIGGYL